jgi:hypothetical protein
VRDGVSSPSHSFKKVADIVLTSKRADGEVEYSPGEFAEIQTVGMEGIEESFCSRPSKYTAVTPRIPDGSFSIGLRSVGWLESEPVDRSAPFPFAYLEGNMLPSLGAQAAAARVRALPRVATEQIRSACMFEREGSAIRDSQPSSSRRRSVERS